MRIGDLVEHQYNSVRSEILDVQRIEMIGLGEQALMHRVWSKPRIDITGPYDLRRERQSDVLFAEPMDGIFREDQLANFAARI